MNIEEEIAQALHDETDEPMWSCVVITKKNLMPLVRRAQAEAWEQAIEEQRLLAPANEADLPRNPYIEQEVEHD